MPPTARSVSAVTSTPSTSRAATCTLTQAPDGLDSNNDINITGGKVEVYGADAMMDAAIDYDGTFTLSGGTLFGAGMEPSAGTQAYIAVGETSPSGGGMGGGRTDRAAVRA